MKNIYFPDFSFTYGRMCVYGRYAPARGSIPARSEVLPQGCSYSPVDARVLNRRTNVTKHKHKQTMNSQRF